MKNNINVLFPFRDDPNGVWRNTLDKTISFVRKSLHAQNLSPTFFISEQIDSFPFFNKGQIYNAGFLEAKKLSSCEHWVFHDADIYETEPGALKYSRYDDGFDHLYGYPKDKDGGFGCLGGIFCTNTASYEKANGYSNDFWGWGFEDIDFYYKTRAKGLKVNSSNTICRDEKRPEISDNPGGGRNKTRMDVNSDKREHNRKKKTWDTGLNTLNYNLIT